MRSSLENGYLSKGELLYVVNIFPLPYVHVKDNTLEQCLPRLGSRCGVPLQVREFASRANCYNLAGILCRYTGNPVEEINPKKKILERLFPDMKTNEGEIAARRLGT